MDHVTYSLFVLVVIMILVAVLVFVPHTGQVAADVVSSGAFSYREIPVLGQIIAATGR